MIVAQDGSGDFITIQEAIDHIPPNSAERVVIRIKNGVYKEKLHLEKSNVSLVGDDPQKTIITYDDYALKTYPNGEPYHTFHSYSLFINADDILVENVTIENSAGPGSLVGQAVAAYVDGDRLRFRNCRFLGHQDTLFTGAIPKDAKYQPAFADRTGLKHSRQYYENCYLQGDVDFIFGSATVVFNRCEIFSCSRMIQDGPDKEVHGWVTAASTPETERFGYVFIDCRLTGNAPPESVYLGRPWRIYAKVAFINCWMGDHIKPEGWHNWNKPESEQTTVYCEYNSTGPGAAPDRRVKWSKQLTPDQAKDYTIGNVLAGHDNWNPLSV